MRMAYAAIGGRSVSRNSSSASQSRVGNGSELLDICENGVEKAAVVAVKTMPGGSAARRTMSATSADIKQLPAGRGGVGIGGGGSGTMKMAPLATSTLTSATLKRKNKVQQQQAKSGGGTAGGGAGGGGQPQGGATDACGRRTMVTLMGGRGYVNWRPVWQSADGVAAARAHKTSTVSMAAAAAAAQSTVMSASAGGGVGGGGATAGSVVPNATDAHVIVWEKKL